MSDKLLGISLIIGVLFVLGSVKEFIVETPLGKVAGTQRETAQETKFYSFLGVPYAKPPVGALRFEPPQEVESWKDTLQAKTIRKCIQYNHDSHSQENILGEEDCLYLNIHTTSLNSEAKLPVIVYIHGGAFMFNYGGMFEPDYFFDKTEMVFVTVNYRLGPFGFLSTEDLLIPGNMGLQDQILALKWIKKYIKYFGGDPGSVTIAGNSAGGASVHLHYLLPESKGLFSRGISQSGTALNCWVHMEEPLKKTRKIASLIDCPTQDKNEMIRCLKEKSAEDITSTVPKFQPFLYNPYSPFGPVVDSWASKPTLPQHPVKLLSQGLVQDVPWIISHTSHEGLYPASDFYFDHHLRTINNNWELLAPHIFDFNFTTSEKSKNIVSQKIRQFYLESDEISKKSYPKLVKAVGDRLFSSDIDQAISLHSKAVNSPIFVYYFTYRGAHSISELYSLGNENLGTSHADDMCYVLKNSFLDMKTTEEDRLVSDILVNIWTSFAKTGHPKAPVNWPSLLSKDYKKNQHVFLKISGSQDISIETTKEFGQRSFWDSLGLSENQNLFKSHDEL